MNTPSRACAAAVVAAIAILVPACGGDDNASSTAKAVNVRCGATITANTTLDNDLVNCPNNGIVIGADDITLDLNGHTVDGNNRPVEPCPKNEFCDVGLRNDGHDGVTVRNGSVREFGTGVFVGRASRNRVVGISSSRHRLFGIMVAESSRSLVRDSSGNANPAPDGDGIGVFGSRDLRILENSFGRNTLGMHVEDSSNISIEGNVFSHNSGPGILMEADRNQVRSNRCLQNEVCIIVGPGSRNVIARNRLTGGEGGILIERGRGNLVDSNVAVDVRRNGIRLGFDDPPIGGANNTVRQNVVRGSGEDGFAVAKRDRQSVLSGNTAIAAGDDGFDIGSRSTKLTGNRAVRNANLGIKAVQGVTDGGRNNASGNGKRLQCMNVVCSGSTAAP
jgi:large repetitive protein